VSTLYFGPRWDAPVVDHAQQVPTPVGLACYDCEEPVVEGDRGLLRGGRPVHAECDLRRVMGHQVGYCSCTGCPPTRESGRLVWAKVFGS
jgi:hypothetical protein